MNFDKKIIINIVEYNKQIKIQQLLNRVLNRFKLKVKVSPLLNNGTDMVSEFQRVNFFHLLNRVLQNNVQGDIVELGCFDGQVATLLQTINIHNSSSRKIYLYDNFKHDFGFNENIRDRLVRNFQQKNLPQPIIVDGNFEFTLKDHLPDQICFLHIDCGYGGDKLLHKNTVLYGLRQTYSRMPEGAIGVLMDYHDTENTVDGVNCNPGAKLAADEFFADKPEKVYTLYGGEYSHGYFVKGLVHDD